MAAVVSAPAQFASQAVSLLRAVGHLQRSERDHAKYRWLWPSAIEAADYVLAAESRCDVLDRIEAQLEGKSGSLVSPLFSSDSRGGQAEDLEGALDRMRANTLPTKSRLALVLGDTAASRWVDGWEELIRLLEILGGLVQFGVLKATGNEARPASADIPSLREFMLERGSLVFRRAIWSLLTGLFALLPIQRAYEQDLRLSAWLALELAETFASGIEEFSNSVLEGIRTAGVPRALKPEIVAEWVSAARASGLDVYFPLGDAEAG